MVSSKEKKRFTIIDENQYYTILSLGPSFLNIRPICLTIFVDVYFKISEIRHFETQKWLWHRRSLARKNYIFMKEAQSKKVFRDVFDQLLLKTSAT